MSLNTVHQERGHRQMLRRRWMWICFAIFAAGIFTPRAAWEAIDVYAISAAWWCVMKMAGHAGWIEGSLDAQALADFEAVQE